MVETKAQVEPLNSSLSSASASDCEDSEDSEDSEEFYKKKIKLNPDYTKIYKNKHYNETRKLTINFSLKILKFSKKNLIKCLLQKYPFFKILF